MNERHFKILKEMIVDFDEYSTDYTKTRCKELEQVLIDTLNYITNLQKENQKLVKGIQDAISYIKQHCEIVRYESENIDKIGKVEGIPLLNILDKLTELKKEVE